MLPDKYSVVFKEDEWTDMTYPVRVRIANLREKWAEHNKHGLPAPYDAVVCLDTLCYSAKCDWDATTTTDILKHLTCYEIEIWCHRWQGMVNGKKPTAASIPANVTLYRASEAWQKNACFLANLYAAAVYYKQIEELAFGGKLHEQIEGLATRGGQWVVEAWDARLKHLETEMKGGTHTLQASLEQKKKPLSRTWMFEAQDGRLADIQNKATARNVAANAGFSRSEKGLINKFAGHIREFGEQEQRAETNAAPSAPQGAFPNLPARAAAPEHAAARERASDRVVVDLTSIQESDNTDDNDDDFVMLGSDPPADWQDSQSASTAAQSPVKFTNEKRKRDQLEVVPIVEGPHHSKRPLRATSSALTSAQSLSKSVATKRKRVDVELEANTIVESFQDNNGRMHHRGTTGRFVKGSGGGKTAAKAPAPKTQAPKASKKPALATPGVDGADDGSADEGGVSVEEEIAASPPSSRLAGSKRRLSSTLGEVDDETVAPKARATEKAKKPNKPAAYKKMDVARFDALLAELRADLNTPRANGDAGNNSDDSKVAETSSSTAAKTARALRSSTTLRATEDSKSSASPQANNDTLADEEESTSAMGTRGKLDLKNSQAKPTK